MILKVEVDELIVALRNEKGSYNSKIEQLKTSGIVALRNEKGSYNLIKRRLIRERIVALRNEKGSYNATLNEK